MRITHIEIERFGVWHQLALPLESSQLNVVHGPNEAGKSTLMRFLRWMLYGDSGKVELSGANSSGLIEVEHQSNHYVIERTGDRLSITGARDLHDHEALQFLRELTGHLSRDTFDNICCFGLEELQQLAVLSGEQIVEKLFGVSLGPQGRFVLDSIRDARAQKEQLARGNDRKLSLRRLLAEHDRLTGELGELGDARQRYRDLSGELSTLERRIESLQTRRDGIDSEQCGHEYLQRVHGPWSTVRELNAKLERLPAIPSFPENGIERLDELELELEEATLRKQALRDEIKQDSTRGRELKRAFPLARSLSAIRLLLEQNHSLQPQLDSADALALRTTELSEDLNRKLAELGPHWSVERLRQLDLSVEQRESLNEAADRYRESMRMLARAKKVITRISRKIQKQQQELETQQQRWQGQSAAQMLERTQEALVEAREWERAALQRTQSSEQLSRLTDQREHIARAEGLPKGARYLLTGFLVFGVLLAILGIWQGVSASGLAGIVYALLGLTCGSLGLAIKWHFESELEQQLFDLDDAIERTRKELSELDRTHPARNQTEEADYVALTSQLQSFSSWVEREKLLESDRKHATHLRSRLPELRREISHTRDEWVQLLRRIGLTETVKIEDAHVEWRQLATLHSQSQRLASLQAQSDALNDVARVFERSVRDVDAQYVTDDKEQTVLSILSNWEYELGRAQDMRLQYRELKRDLVQSRREFKQLLSRIKHLRGMRAKLLAEGHAHDRATFDRNAIAFLERRDLTEHLDEAERELDRAAATESQIALVEEELLTFDPVANRERLEVLQREAAALRDDLEDAYEQRGRCREQLDTLRGETRQRELRQSLVEIEEQIAAQCEHWLGLDQATRALDAVKSRLERDHRPQTLRRAEQFFRQLTNGRYQHLWAPLGERDVHVEDHTGLARTLNELSGGTREQLLLSLRLALVEEQRERGVAVPFVLDDILVNFDQTRMFSAIDTLVEFANSGTQILLLTCHQHLADFSQNRGIAVTRLPERHPFPERLAG